MNGVVPGNPTVGSGKRQLVAVAAAGRALVDGQMAASAFGMQRRHAGRTVLAAVGSRFRLQEGFRHQQIHCIFRSAMAVPTRAQPSFSLPFGVVADRTGGDILHPGVALVIPGYVTEAVGDGGIRCSGRRDHHTRRSRNDQQEGNGQ